MSEDFAAIVNRLPGWVREMGVTILEASADEVTCEWEVSEKHHQGYGIVHGGVHCGAIETVASVGAALVAMPRGQRVVGLENSTSFVRAVRSGRLRASARPVTRGRTTQVWEVRISDELNVDLAPDGRSARVFVHVDGDDDDAVRSMEGLSAAVGFIRRELTERLRLRRAPDLIFQLDRSPQYQARINELLGRTRKRQKKNAQ